MSRATRAPHVTMLFTEAKIKELVMTGGSGGKDGDIGNGSMRETPFKPQPPPGPPPANILRQARKNMKKKTSSSSVKPALPTSARPSAQRLEMHRKNRSSRSSRFSRVSRATSHSLSSGGVVVGREVQADVALGKPLNAKAVALLGLET